MKHFISLGAGVQSSTMALMAAHGEITPMPDAAIFADTQSEPESVYKWLDWLEKELPYPVIRATRGNLAQDALRLRKSAKSGKYYTKPALPVFTIEPSGTKGLMMRGCTLDYKITVIQREIRKHTASAVVWMGISRDEVIRMKPSRVPWIEHRFPLIDMNVSRYDCIRWMEREGYPEPPRSACWMCPYHSDREWLRLKTEEPAEFAKAVAWESNYRTALATPGHGMRADAFLHRSLVPLDQVQFDPQRQGNLFGNECEGMCGV